MKQHYDIIVLGSGLVGLTAANLLAQNVQISIAIIDPNKPLLEWDHSQYDVRCSAISRASQKIFESLGIWHDIKTDRIGPYEKMTVWERQGYGEITFDCEQLNEPNLGHIIENRVMVRALWSRLLKYNNVEAIEAAAVSYKNETSQVVIETSQESRTITGKLVLGADGVNSWLRKSLLIPTQGWDYQQTAMVATIECESGHQKVARQCFEPKGPLAFLPLDHPHFCSIVWSIQTPKLDSIKSLTDEQFCDLLAEQFDYRLGLLKIHGKRNYFPLRMIHAKNYIAERAALLGDAAHVIHPLAGQGVNLGLLDACAIAEVITEAHQKGCDVGHPLILRKYERWRKGHNLSMIAAMEFFKQLFNSEVSWVKSLRNMGLNYTDKFSVAKTEIIRRAMGLKGDLPAIVVA